MKAYVVWIERDRAKVFEMKEGRKEPEKQEPPAWTTAAKALIVGAALSLPFTPAAWASTPQWEEIPVTKVFVAEYGFDDNDNVELVADGLLPNACFSVGPGRIDANALTRTLTYHQLAHRDLTGPCVMTSTLPPAAKRPIPYTVETSIGRLPAATYGVKYQQSPTVAAERRLNVARATSLTVDSLPYALVTGIELADFVRADSPVTAYLTGILTNTCAHLNPLVQVLNEGDVFVALPTLKYDLVNEARDCADLTLPFRLPVNLGKPATGRYLLHVRSMSGKAVNKVFSVFSDT